MEGAELGLYMISACAFVVLLEYPTSPVYQALPDPALRRVLIGIAMGMAAIGIMRHDVKCTSVKGVKDGPRARHSRNDDRNPRFQF